MPFLKCYNFLIIKVVLITILLLKTIPVYACTCFAVYNSKVFYGMNFDYPNVELRFSVSQYNGIKIFQAQFVENDRTSAFCGMNNNGIFSTIQMLYPKVTTWTQPKANEIDLYQAYISALMGSSNLQQTLDNMNASGIKVIHIQGATFHDFFADKNKTACVLEVGSDKNLITKMENDFLIMTNFPINQFVGKPLSEINGTGSDRYKTAYQYIQENKSNFNYENGIETLKRTVQTSGSFPTQVSFLLDPVNSEVYIMLKRDFTKIWKLSINDETIETYTGFNGYKKISLPVSGISASELQNLTSVNENIKPNNIFLNQNYPNPFNPSTTINYKISNPAASKGADYIFVQLKIYDILGNEIETLVEKYQAEGEYKVEWQPRGLTAGIYFYRLKAGEFLETRKLVYLE